MPHVHQVASSRGLACYCETDIMSAVSPLEDLTSALVAVIGAANLPVVPQIVLPAH